MNNEIKRASKALFETPGVETVNVKFFLGTNRSVTAEQLAEQFNRAEAQIRNGVTSPSTTLDGALTSKAF